MDLEFFSWKKEMITRDVDIYAREKYGDELVHVFGTDVIPAMPLWDSDGYAAKKIQKLFIQRGEKVYLEKEIE